eukprot:scaffold5828_cov168-Amphora_coffeaeformis.AAC.5
MDGNVIHGAQMRFRDPIRIIGDQRGTMRVVVQPRRPVTMPTHALHPSIRITDHDGGKDIVGRQIGQVIVRPMGLSKGFILHGRVLAPQDLPPNALLILTVLGLSCRHVTIGQEQFG